MSRQYGQVVIDEFEGLTLNWGPDAVGPQAAIDLLDVEFDQRGAVRQRDGSKRLSGVLAGIPEAVFPFYSTAGHRELVAASDNLLSVVSSAGVVGATRATTGGGSSTVAVRYGGPVGQKLVVANGQEVPWEWNGTAFAQSAYTGRTPKPKLLAVTQQDNRMVYVEDLAEPTKTFFSDAGNPLAVQANNYVQLHPGDGERHMAALSWREYTFVWKESKFFVFYGQSVDTDGNPEFNYRAVNAGVGCASPNGACVGRDGVYFFDATGIYRTTGGEPELISQPVDPIFRKEPREFYRGGYINPYALDQCTLRWHQERLYFAFPTSAAVRPNRVLVFDPRYRYWTLWSLNAGALTSFDTGDGEILIFGHSGEAYLHRTDRREKRDHAGAISSYWRSGFGDFGEPAVKHIRESYAWGTGSISVGLAADFATSPTEIAVDFDALLDTWGDGSASQTWGDGTTSDKWGIASEIRQARIGRDQKGTYFATAFSNNVLNEDWSVHRVVHHVVKTRKPSVMIAAP